jgi:hypothetical protein
MNDLHFHLQVLRTCRGSRQRSLKIVALAVWALLARPASAELILDLSADPNLDGTTSATFKRSPSTWGWSFRISSPLPVAALGIWDEIGGILANRHMVGLWDSSRNLLAQATVDNMSIPVASQSSKGRWLFTNITPITIPAGTYILGAYYPNPAFVDPFRESLQETTIPGVTAVDRRDALPTNAFVFPDSDIVALPTGYFGPNLSTTAVSTSAQTTQYVIAHFPYGGGWISRTIIEAGSSGATVDVNFFNQAGKTAIVPLVGEGNESMQRLVLAPNAVQVVAADPTHRNVDPKNVTVTWALATSTGPLNVFTLFDYAPSSTPTSQPATKILGSVGAQSTVATKSFRFPISVYGPLAYDGGVAIANPNGSSITYTATLLNADGSTKDSVQATLPPQGQTIFLVTDIFKGVITADSVHSFDGSLVICASQPVGVVAIGVEGSALFTTSVTNDFQCQ